MRYFKRDYCNVSLTNWGQDRWGIVLTDKFTLSAARINGFNVVFLLKARSKSVSGCKATTGNRYIAFSDLFVGVEHNSERVTHGSGREVLGESHADTTVLTVGGDDSSPSALVVLAGVGVLTFPDVSNALSVVVLGGSAVGATLNVDESLSLMLESLTTSESSEDCLLVESRYIIGYIKVMKLT